MTTPTANVDVGHLQQTVQSLAMATGVLESLAGHEAETSPHNGLTGGLWLSYVGPDPRHSGLATSAARIEWTLRIYIPTSGTTPEQLDSIDPTIGSATVTIMAALSAQFTLDGEVFAVDLLGMGGRAPLSAKPGWATYGDAKVRVIDITIPLMLDAVWQQGEIA